MATISSIVAPARGNTSIGRGVYMVEKTIDFAVTTVDPSSADVVQMMTFDADTCILHAGIEVMTALTGAGSDATVDLGCSSVDADGFVDGFDIDGASAGDHAAPNMADAAIKPQTVGASDTLDLTFAGTDNGIATGKLRVYALCMDVSPLGDMEANIVDRDMLA
tara:strand:+ start:52 stop:543 length:492 start_codon:yes stop_codon:yes gene_type:complete